MQDERLSTDEGRESAVIGTGSTVGNHATEDADRRPLVADGGSRITELLEALADDRRRYVLYYLRDEGDAELEEVTEQVAARETDAPPEELDQQTKRNIRIELSHAHLPKLEDAGIIRYDHRHGSVSFLYPSDPLERFLDYCATIESPETIE